MVILFVSWSCPVFAQSNSFTFYPTTPHAASESGAGDSSTPILSEDGQWLVFESTANNLVANDDHFPGIDLFRYHRETRVTELITVSLTGQSGGNGHSGYAQISSNGQWIVFASEADNLVLGDTNGSWDVFLRDMNTGGTLMVSGSFDGVTCSQGDTFGENYQLSSRPRISSDGRWVAYESHATNLVDLPDQNRASDIYLYDVVGETNRLITVNKNGDGAALGSSRGVSISSDARYIAFASTAADLVGADTEGRSEIYVWDRMLERLIHVSRHIQSLLPNVIESFDVVMSKDGSSAVFKVRMDTSEVRVVHHMLAADALTLVGGIQVLDHASIVLSDDGQMVACEAREQDVTYVHLWRVQDPTNSIRLSPYETECQGTNRPAPTQLPSLTADGNRLTYLAGDEFCLDGAWFLYDVMKGQHQSLVIDSFDLVKAGVSSDGDYFVWDSAADDLSMNDLNRARDVFELDLHTMEVTLVSRILSERSVKTGPGFTGMTRGAFSANGNKLALISAQDLFTLLDTNFVNEIFVVDLKYQTNQWIQSVERGSDPDDLFGLGEPILDAHGRYVLFNQKTIYPRVGGDGYRVYNLVHWMDLVTGVRIGISDGPTTLAQDGLVPGHAISPSGLRVALQTPERFSNFGLNVDELANNDDDILLWSRIDGRSAYEVISIALDMPRVGNGPSMNPQFSPDEQWIVFYSLATDLVASGVDGINAQLYARHLPTRTTRLLSLSPDGTGMSGCVTGVVFSADSRYLAFYDQKTHRGYRYEFQVGARNEYPVTEICSDCTRPVLSGDGRGVAYQTVPDDGAHAQIMWRDLDSNETKLVSGSYGDGTPGNADSTFPLLGYDGRFLVFLSEAGNLVEGDTNMLADLYVHDRWRNVTFSPTAIRLPHGAPSYSVLHPIMAPDGRTVAFQSYSDDILPGDYNGQRDVFLVRLGGEDKDEDNMEDEWEMTFFDSLDRDGKGDADGDGVSDKDEHRLGTNPTSDESVLAITRISVNGNLGAWENSGRLYVTWVSKPGQRYRVQSKSTVTEQPWSDVPESELTARGTTCSYVFEENYDRSDWLARKRFYRVIAGNAGL